MNKKNILFIFLSLPFFINNGLYAGDEDQDRNVCGFPALIRKCLNCFVWKQELDNIFFLPKAPSQHHYKQISQTNDLEYDELKFQKEVNLLIFPSEIIHGIAKFLSPVSIISLSKSNSRLITLQSADFWKHYNIYKKYSIWDKNVLPIKVAFAHYWFENGSMTKSAKLGFPKAITFLKNKDKVKKNKVPINVSFSPESGFIYYHPMGGSLLQFLLYNGEENEEPNE